MTNEQLAALRLKILTRRALQIYLARRGKYRWTAKHQKWLTELKPSERTAIRHHLEIRLILDWFSDYRLTKLLEEMIYVAPSMD